MIEIVDAEAGVGSVPQPVSRSTRRETDSETLAEREAPDHWQCRRLIMRPVFGLTLADCAKTRT